MRFSFFKSGLAKKQSHPKLANRRAAASLIFAVPFSATRVKSGMAADEKAPITVAL
jgi:hypothetical protein